MSDRKGPSIAAPAVTSGFTLVEFVVAVTLASIALTLALPALQQFLANNQIISTSNTIVSGLNMARSTAVTTGEDITICPSSDGSSCTKDDWESGWIIFQDLDGDSEADDDEIIRVVSIENDVDNSGFGENIVFQSDGTTTMDSSAVMTSCHESKAHEDVCMQVLVNRFGLISSKKYLSGNLHSEEGES